MDNSNASNPSTAPLDNERSWQLIEQLSRSSLVEQRRARRWGIVFKLLTFAYVGILIYFFTQSTNISTDKVTSLSGQHTALVDIIGEISPGQDAQAAYINTGLREAFKDENTKAVLLRINSPGGTPVQAGYVYDEIKRLRAQYPAIKVYAVVSDLCASGAYYIASAADEIYADKASLIGSIGVIASQFGFVEAIEKLGVERRTYTAGENKGFLDPFLPVNPEEADFWQRSLDVVHQQFIDQVKKGRGARLSDNDKLFSGLIWPGEKAKDLGLIDGFGSPSYVAREIIGEENTVNFSYRRTPLERFIRELGVSMGQGVATALGLSKDQVIKL